MSLTDQPAAYLDCYRLYEAAVNSGKTARAHFTTRDQASYFQLRMHKARAIQRAESRRIFPKDSPLYDKSEFDAYQCVVREDTDGEWWVMVQLHGIQNLHIEIVDDDEALPTTEDLS